VTSISFALPKVVSELEDHVGPRRHLPVLPVGEVLEGVHDPRLARVRVQDRERRRGLLVAELHVPGEAVSLFCPAHVARIEEVPQGHHDLDERVETQ
jgi:hypothetical protein